MPQRALFLARPDSSSPFATPGHCACQLRTKLFAAQPNAQWKGMPPAHRAEPLRYHAGKHRIAFRRGAIMDGPYCSQSPALIGVTPSTRLIGVSPSPGSPAGSPFDWRLKQSVPITSTKHLAELNPGDAFGTDSGFLPELLSYFRMIFSQC